MSNLLDKASVILTPTAYNTSEALCVKPSDGTGDFDFSRATEATRINSLGLVETIGINLPRINYEGGCGSWLFEPQSTNLVTYSEDFTQWNSPNSSVVNNAIQSPSGEINAAKIVEDASLSVHKLDLGTVANATQYTLSVFAKAGERSVLSLAGLGLYANDEFPQYDLINGTAINTGTTNNATVSIDSYGNGWYRCATTYTSTGTSGAVIVMLDQLYSGNPNTGGGQTYQGDGVSGLYIYGAQIEQNSYATSYIPTSGSQVTRNQDVCNNGGSLATINSTEGVLYAEIAALANDGTNRAIALSDGSTSNVVRFYYSVTDNRIVGNVKSGGTTFFNFNNVLSSATDFLKVAISYRLNEFKMYVNGTLVFTDTSGNTPIGLNELVFNNGAGNDIFFGKTKAVAVWKEALSDQELTELTTI